MMKISDSIRKWCDLAELDCFPCDELRELANRIDRELVEMPKDRDGVPIHVGDIVYSPGGKECCVKEITIIQQGVCVKCAATDTTISTLFPYDLTHERPDSWERIAEDIEERIGTGVIDGSTLCKWVERIRKLAEKEDK